MYQFLPEELKIPPKAIQIKIQGSDTFDASNFNPGGLSSYTSKGRVNLYVVSNGPKGDTVECFLFDKAKKTATHMKSIKDDLIYA